MPFPRKLVKLMRISRFHMVLSKDLTKSIWKWKRFPNTYRFSARISRLWMLRMPFPRKLVKPMRISRFHMGLSKNLKKSMWKWKSSPNINRFRARISRLWMLRMPFPRKLVKPMRISRFHMVLSKDLKKSMWK